MLFRSQTYKFWSGAELAGRLEVSQRTLRRDVDRLRELGYPVEATPGAAGGYRLDLHGLALNVSKFLDQQKREQKYGMEHLAIDTDELDTIVAKLKQQGIHILEETVVSGGRRVCFFEGPDGVQLEFIEMK